MERNERRGTQGQHKLFQIALSLNNAAVWRGEGEVERGGGVREEIEKRKDYSRGCARLCREKELHAEQ